MAFLLFYPSASAGSEKIGFNIHSFGDAVQFNGVGQTLGYNTSMTASAPTYSFQGDTNTGIYASAADTINLATGGTSRVALTTTTLSTTLPVYAADGSASAPSYAFTNSTGSGLYYTGTANTIALATSGTARLTINTATVDSALPLRVTGTTNYLLVNTTDRTYRSTNGGATVDQPLQIGSSTGSAGFSYLGLDHAGGATDMGLNFNMLNTNSQIIRTACLVLNSTGSGASRTAGSEVGSIGFYVKPSGSSVSEWGRISANGSSGLQLLASDGSASIPTVSFINDNDTGFYRSGTNNIDITTNGTRRLNIDSSGNMALGASPSFGSGQVVIFIANATAVPSANPTGGGILYVESGALKYRGSSGTISTIAPA
jgi:hypothetical protein